MISLGEFKRGDTFIITTTLKDEAGEELDLEPSDLVSQVRDKFGNLLAPLTITSGGATGVFVLQTSDTAEWPCEKVYLDIEMSVAGRTISSPTVEIRVIKDVTQHE